VPTKTAHAGGGLSWKRGLSAAAFAIVGPLVGIATLFAGLLVTGGSVEGGDGSGPAYLALVIPVAWGLAAFATSRRLGGGRILSAALAVVAVAWGACSWILVVPGL
jgi:hypothetical protein